MQHVQFFHIQGWGHFFLLCSSSSIGVLFFGLVLIFGAIHISQSPWAEALAEFIYPLDICIQVKDREVPVMDINLHCWKTTEEREEASCAGRDAIKHWSSVSFPGNSHMQLQMNMCMQLQTNMCMQQHTYILLYTLMRGDDRCWSGCSVCTCECRHRNVLRSDLRRQSQQVTSSTAEGEEDLICQPNPALLYVSNLILSFHWIISWMLALSYIVHVLND